jgi:undecaprenyl-diphosphatase
MDSIAAIILAIIEGITEYLPVSSTGHMIIASSFMKIAEDDFTKLFTIVIQLGAIFAVVALYWKRFFQSFDFYLKLGVAFLPAASLGLLFNDAIDVFRKSSDRCCVAYCGWNDFVKSGRLVQRK